MFKFKKTYGYYAIPLKCVCSTFLVTLICRMKAVKLFTWTGVHFTRVLLYMYLFFLSPVEKLNVSHAMENMVLSAQLKTHKISMCKWNPIWRGEQGGKCLYCDLTFLRKTRFLMEPRRPIISCTV